VAQYFANIESLRPNVVRLRFGRRAPELRILSVSEVHALWVDDAGFCRLFSQVLADVPFDAFFWETPPLRPETFDAPFECVVVATPSLARQSSSSKAFASRFVDVPTGAIAFDNLGGDATLVVPVNGDETTDYCHLASFLRTAKPDQVDAVWALVSRTAQVWLERGDTCWISTSGLGVPWLHVRIEASPKYYSYGPYGATPT